MRPMKSGEVRGSGEKDREEEGPSRRHAHLRPISNRRQRNIDERRSEEGREEKEQMPLLLQVSSFVTLHLLHDRETSMNLSVFPV